MPKDYQTSRLACSSKVKESKNDDYERLTTLHIKHPHTATHITQWFFIIPCQYASCSHDCTLSLSHTHSTTYIYLVFHITKTQFCVLSKLNTGFFLPQIATILFLKCRPPFFCLCPQNPVSPCQTNVNLEPLWNNNVEKSKTAQITTYKNNMGLEQLASIARTSLSKEDGQKRRRW